MAAVAPELVVRGADGQPETVRYHLLVPMLLNEIQRLSRQADDSAREMTELRARLSALEQPAR